jgi:dihydroorotate dehydrogenase electron transfer subunit
MKNLLSIIESIENFSDVYFKLTVKTDVSRTTNLGSPGQFYQIKVIDSGFGLRLPISIYDIQGQYISFLVKAVGSKTKKLQSFTIGTELDLIGPLGTSFEILPSQNYLFVTGGIGYAPLSYLYQQTMGGHITWVHGGQSKEDVVFADKATVITTNDGSVGTKGLVTDEVIKLLDTNSYDKVFTCGPDTMMKALYAICHERNIPIEVSLEEYMACGVGVCYGCAVKIKNVPDIVPMSTPHPTTYKRVCKDGPVFDAYTIVWEDK